MGSFLFVVLDNDVLLRNMVITTIITTSLRHAHDAGADANTAAADEDESTNQ